MESSSLIFLECRGILSNSRRIAFESPLRFEVTCALSWIPSIFGMRDNLVVSAATRDEQEAIRGGLIDSANRARVSAYAPPKISWAM